MWDEAAKAFLFGIGDVVIHKTTARHGGAAIRFVVVERSLSQCHGGIQRLYAVKTAVQESVYARREHPYEIGHHIFNETEVMAEPPPETEFDRLERLVKDIGGAAKRVTPDDIKPVG